jgi:hypothetical protein
LVDEVRKQFVNKLISLIEELKLIVTEEKDELKKETCRRELQALMKQLEEFIKCK